MLKHLIFYGLEWVPRNLTFAQIPQNVPENGIMQLTKKDVGIVRNTHWLVE
jgi:hypothetical protein